ncbi:MAG TPA: hypothetical protein VFR71_00840 [Methyloceanibacter sp.]|jgi:hypothetical protein|nr:hypothetical protein [Methyloceanibacter sp.]
MESQFSLTSMLIAITMFVVTTAMHEASRAEHLVPHGAVVTLFEWTDLMRTLW